MSALHIPKEEGLIMKLFRTISVYLLFTFVEKFSISHDTSFLCLKVAW